MATKTKTKPETIVNSKGKTLTLSASGNSYQATRAPEVKTKFTNTSGEKVTVMTDGSKTRTSPKTSGGSDGGIGVISSNQGKDMMKKADETITRLSPEPITADPNAPTQPTQPTTATASAPAMTATASAPTAPAPDTSKDFVTYYNESTGQEQTLRGEAINDLNKKSLEQQGYKISTSDTATYTAPKDPEIEKLESSISEYDRQIGEFMQGLTDTLVTDKELRSEIRGLKNTYRQRVADEKQITDQRVQALTTLGIRTGSRYTGGTNGVMGSIITEEEREGLRRITELDTQLESKINEAKRSAQEQNYKVYAQQVQYAEKLKEQKVTEVAALKKLAAEENKKKVEMARTSLIDSVISSFIDQGVTNRGELFAKLSDPAIAGVIGGVTAEEFKKTFDALMPTGTGIIGEYEYYKREAQRMGQTPLSFDDYQTRDANRKRPVTNILAGSGNVPTAVVSQVDKLSSSFDTNQIVKNFVEVQNKKLSIDSILSSGVKGPGDLAIVFEFMKALDPTSVVREQEYANASKSGNIFQGTMARFNGYFAPGGGFLDENIKNDFQTIINQKLNVAETQYDNLRNETARKIEMKTSKFDPTTPGADYLTDYAGAGTGQSIIEDEQKAETAIVQWVSTSPENAQKLRELQQIAPDASLSEIAQELGISL